MKLRKIGFAALFIVYAAIAFGQNKPTGGYILSGTARGIPDGMVEMSLYDLRTRTSTTLNSTQVKDEKFVFTGKLQMPAQVELTFKPGNWATRFFHENGLVSIAIDTAAAQHYDLTKQGRGKGAQLTKVEVRGSKGHEDIQAYEAITAGATRANFAELSAKQLDSLRSYIAKNPSSVAAALMLNTYYLYHATMPISEIEGMLAKLTGEAKNSLYYSNLQTEITERKSVEPGSMVADFTLMKPDSAKFTLSSLKGKYVLLDFWASWCAPCRAAIPHWKEVYTKYKDKGFEIVGVTNDNDWAKWKMALGEEQMPWIQVADEFPIKNMPARVLSKYKHPTIPLYVLLDKSGKILAKTGNKADIDRLLAAQLGN